MKDYGSLINILLAAIESGHSTKRFYQILNKRSEGNYTDQSIRVTLSRLKKAGYISKNNKDWLLTKKGTAYRKQALLYSYIPSPFSPSVKNKLIISFDVPESRRIDRNWLRNQIRIFGYTMLQQSLWIGPGPLPKEFKERLSTLKLDALVKIFSLSTKT